MSQSNGHTRNRKSGLTADLVDWVAIQMFLKMRSLKRWWRS
jgi:hypothetical protein